MHENAKGTMIGLTAEMGILYQEQNVMMAEQINRTHPELIRRAKSKREYMYQAIFFIKKNAHLYMATATGSPNRVSVL
jgi:hypothetical protein